MENSRSRKHSAVEEPVPFQGLQLKQIAEIDMQSVGNGIWLFMKRKDGSIVRVWITDPRRDQPLHVTIEVEDA
jgi:hypothetical protein